MLLVSIKLLDKDSRCPFFLPSERASTSSLWKEPILIHHTGKLFSSREIPAINSQLAKPRLSMGDESPYPFDPPPSESRYASYQSEQAMAASKDQLALVL